MTELRLVSFLPSATELACSLGLADHLVGISHECDYPPEICAKPVVVHGALPFSAMSMGDIDSAVSQRLKRGQSLYEVDLELLRELAPTHMLTQALCQVCAPAGNEVSRALGALESMPEVVWMSPHSIADIHGDLRSLGAITGRLEAAESIIAETAARLERVAQRAKGKSKPRVFCAEWAEPFYCSGHWVPEMVEIAGGIDVLGRKWKDSVRVSMAEIVAMAPESLIFMPCGFDLKESVALVERLMENPAWLSIPAVQTGHVYAVDACYFSRPSLRVVEGTELLAHLMHPDIFEWIGPRDAFRRLPLHGEPKACSRCSGKFLCQVNTLGDRCWCSQLPLLSPPDLTEGGCLCPNCLSYSVSTTNAQAAK